MVWQKWNGLKLSESSKQKMSEYCSTQFNIKVCRTQKHTNICLISGIILISQDVMIGYVNLRAKMKVH